MQDSNCVYLQYILFIRLSDKGNVEFERIVRK